jgi:hypothetical protein
MIDSQQVVLDHDTFGLVRPRETIDPLAMRARPIAPVVMQPAAQQQLAQPVATPLQIFTCVIARAAQIADRFFFGRRWLDFRQQAGAQQLHQLARIAAIRLHPFARFSWDECRRDHLTTDTRRCHLALQRIATRTGFVTRTHGPGRFSLELPHEATHRIRLVRDGPRHWRGLPPNQHRNEEVFLVRINPNVRSNLFHDRLLSMRLWRRKALTRDFGGIDHLVECDSTTTLR